jgi:hypothetical protein
LPRTASFAKNSRMRRARRRGSETGAPAEQASVLERHVVLPAIALLGAAAVIAFAAQLYPLWRFTPDEAFVAFRYALNWAAG